MRLTAAGAEEVPLDESDARTILAAADRHVAALRADPATIAARIPDLLTDMMEAVGRPLGRALELALDGQPRGRLVWVPQGSLVSVPIAACPCGDTQLVERAATIMAPSLATAMAALEADRPIEASLRAIRGRRPDRQAPTEGNSALLASLGAAAVAESEPSSVDELNRTLTGASLVQLTCHGVYNWEDPLRSYLKLGEGLDLSVKALIDAVIVEPDALISLGVCDSGTVAQTSINEAIGVPLALRTAGARAVIGAGWPVMRAIALAVGVRFFRHLAEGMASPEALQCASGSVRELTFAELERDLRASAHPAAEEIAGLPPARRTQPVTDHPYLWASYLHWGGGCCLLEPMKDVGLGERGTV